MKYFNKLGWISNVINYKDKEYQVISSEFNGHLEDTLDTLRNTKTKIKKTKTRKEWKMILGG